MTQKYTRIFAALDGASTQEAVADRALSLAADNGAHLLFGHVVDSVPNEMNGADYQALCAERLKLLEQELAPTLARAREDARIPSVDVRVAAGRVADTLMEELAQPFNPDLVVCGERGLSNIKYAFVGSVSTFLIRNMRCDVLVVKQD
ncbi:MULTISPECIES: universal stress protein [Gordonibacter]|uniref:Universal stress protein n=1 Tax=Gordonibacter faecis TaxID=3047475 RepID=A0ABT7DP68_9ACTN|nr:MULTISPECIES: universal stress protein [unclassified Gordonibacter]MDJ1651334.1 universal stress protein [Gordonibacter sp. KGMB12511]HIW76261.1 universal stress protein [Candidatus Gordonibacter avicola]